MEKGKLLCILRVYLHFVIVRENSLSVPQKPVGIFFLCFVDRASWYDPCK